MPDHPLAHKLRAALPPLTAANLLLDEALALSQSRSIEHAHRLRLRDIRANIRRQKTLLQRLLSKIYGTTDPRLSPRHLPTESAAPDITSGKWEGPPDAQLPPSQ